MNSKYSYLNRYLLKSQEISEAEINKFWPINLEDIEKAEKIMEIEFPLGLKEFWKEIGDGRFLHTDPSVGIFCDTYSNIIMDPLEIAKIMNEIVSWDGSDEGYEKMADNIMDGKFPIEAVLEGLEKGEYYFPFFYMGDGVYLSMKEGSESIYHLFFDLEFVEKDMETFVYNLYYKHPAYYAKKLFG